MRERKVGEGGGDERKEGGRNGEHVWTTTCFVQRRERGDHLSPWRQPVLLHPALFDGPFRYMSMYLEGGGEGDREGEREGRREGGREGGREIEREGRDGGKKLGGKGESEA